MKNKKTLKNHALNNKLDLKPPDLRQGSIKKIEKHDEADFYNMLQLAKVDDTLFENHWQYIIQATRNCGFVYKNNQTRIYYYFNTSQNLNDLVIVNFFGPEKIQGLSTLKEYANKNNFSLCIKNIPIDDVPLFESLGYCEKKTSWNKYSSKDDNSFPECIFELKSIAEAHLPLTPGNIRTCRASHANRLRKFLKERNICIKEYEPNLHQDTVYKLLVENANFLEKKGVDSQKNVLDAHMFVFNNDLSNKVRLIHTENDCILGFNYITIVNNAIFGDALIHKNSPDLMRFLVWQGFNYLYNHLDKTKNYYVTLQGSENNGQYNWKRGFAPLREIIKTHMTPKEKYLIEQPPEIQIIKSQKRYRS